MLSRPERYDGLAVLLEYPRDDGFAERLLSYMNRLPDEYETSVQALRPFYELVLPMGAGEVQELYTRTFDIDPVCTLEVGWHIYGEDYARGAFLVKMRELLREHNILETRELPDHLSHCLMLLARLSGERADDFVARFLLPGMKKMFAGFDKKESPYRSLLEAVHGMTRVDHDVEEIEPRKRRSSPPDWKNRLPMFSGSKS